MKKIIYIVTILLLIIVLHNPTSTTIVESNKYRIPANPAFDDDNFYKCVIDKYNSDGRVWKGSGGVGYVRIRDEVSYDANLTDEQLASITYLSCYPSNYNDDSTKISSTKGLEKLTGLTSLILSDHNLTSIDLSHNTALTNLDLGNNQLTNIDVSHNTTLTDLSLYNNQLTSIDLSGNTALTTLYLYNNQLTSIDLSHNTALTNLDLGNNQLTNIDVSHNTALTTLYLYNNQLTSIDLSHNTSLTSLSLDNNNLTSVDLSHNTALSQIELTSNQLTSIDVTNNTNLNRLSVDENVEVVGASDQVTIGYAPIYMFSNNVLKFNESMFKSGKYEYIVNVSNSIDKFAVGFDEKAKGFYYKCPDDTLCGGYYLFQLLSAPSEYGQVTFNDSKIDLSQNSIFKEVNDYWEEIHLDTLKEEQCTDKNECDVYYNDKLVDSIHNGIETIYKDDQIIAKNDGNDRITTIYKGGKEIYVVDQTNHKIYVYVSDLKEGTNVLKITININGIDAEYTINIVRSGKELNNDPNKELEDIAKDIVDSNNIDYPPDTGMFTAILLSILSIGIVVELYFVYYRKKVKN